VQTICENLKEAELRPCIAFHNAPRHYLPTEENDMGFIDVDEGSSMTDDLCEKYFKKL
jgi:hypothetical protein